MALSNWPSGVTQEKLAVSHPPTKKGSEKIPRKESLNLQPAREEGAAIGIRGLQWAAHCPSATRSAP